MLGNDDNSNSNINVNKGGNGTSKGTVTIDISKYEKMLELAFKLAILKEVMFADAMLSNDGKSLVCSIWGDAGRIAKYLFPEEYAEKLAELTKEDGE